MKPKNVLFIGGPKHLQWLTVSGLRPNFNVLLRPDFRPILYQSPKPRYPCFWRWLWAKLWGKPTVIWPRPDITLMPGQTTYKLEKFHYKHPAGFNGTVWVYVHEDISLFSFSEEGKVVELVKTALRLKYT